MKKSLNAAKKTQRKKEVAVSGEKKGGPPPWGKTGGSEASTKKVAFIFRVLEGIYWRKSNWAGRAL